MPQYDYICNACGHEFEKLHGMDEKAPKTCPECKRQKVRRNFKSAPAIHHHYSPMHPRANRGRGY